MVLAWGPEAPITTPSRQGAPTPKLVPMRWMVLLEKQGAGDAGTVSGHGAQIWGCSREHPGHSSSLQSTGSWVPYLSHSGCP